MISNDQINLYFRNGYRSEVRQDAEKKHKAIAIHSRKVTPTEILEAFRPNEAPAHREYRIKAYKPNTFGYFSKVKQQFVKIRAAEDWRIEWPQLPTNALKEYTQVNFPLYDTMENWLFNVHLQAIIDDPEGVTISLPRYWREVLSGTATADALADPQPMPFYFNSTQIREFTDTLLVVQLQEEAEGGPVTGKEKLNVQYFFDADQMVRVVETRGSEGRAATTYARTGAITHNWGFTAIINGGYALPAEVGGAVRWDSFIAPALPAWDEAIEIESDHKVDRALHLHPDRWEVVTLDCPNKQCSEGFITREFGRGPNKRTQRQKCPTCDGTQKVARRTPFGVHQVHLAKTGPGVNSAVQPPIPPAGYILRPIESIKTMKELGDRKIFDGLVALNLEMLAGGIGLNQSGTAKELDRSEITAYLLGVATHIVENILRPHYYFAARIMEPGLTDEARKRFEPVINIPTKYDVLTVDVLNAQLLSYATNGGSNSAKAEIEIAQAEKRYGKDSLKFKQIKAVIDLDPLYSIAPADKVTLAQAGACSLNQFIISCQINYLVRRAASETENGFFDLELDEQRDKLEEYAEEVASKPSAAAALAKIAAANAPKPANQPVPTA